MALRSDAKFHFLASLQSMNSCFWFCAKLNGCLPRRHIIDLDFLRFRSPGTAFFEHRQALEQTQIYARIKVEGGMCTWGVKGRWRGSVAHHSFCQQVVIGVSVVGSEERVS